MDDYIIMKAIKFPFINVLWIGTVLMVLGFGISLFKRFIAK
jgi:cytochrome c-type biogenesis protein CcmF